MKSTNGSEHGPAESAGFCNGMLDVLEVQHVPKCCVGSAFPLGSLLNNQAKRRQAGDVCFIQSSMHFFA